MPTYMRPSVLALTLAAWGAQAAPIVVTSSDLEQTHVLSVRKPVITDSDMVIIGENTPLDAILLVAVALAFALFSLFFALFHVLLPRSGGRIVLEERARAKTELRLRGGTPRTSPSHTPHSPSAEFSRRSKTEMSVSSAASHSRLISNAAGRPLLSSTNRGSSLGPKVDTSRPSRSARGYSISSVFKHDVANSQNFRRTHANNYVNGRPEVPSMASMLAIPRLPAAQMENVSTGSLSSGGSSGGKQRATDQRIGGHSHQRSSTIGRGTDLSRNRSLKERAAPPVHVHPMAVDPAYDGGRSSPNDLAHPLSGYELKRFVTEPSDSRDTSRRNSAMSMLDHFGGNSHNHELIQLNDGSGSSGNHATSSVQHPAVASSLPGGVKRPQHDRMNSRTRPYAMYETDQDAFASTADSTLLESGPNSPRGNPNAKWKWYN